MWGVRPAGRPHCAERGTRQADERASRAGFPLSYRHRAAGSGPLCERGRPAWQCQEVRPPVCRAGGKTHSAARRNDSTDICYFATRGRGLAARIPLHYTHDLSIMASEQRRSHPWPPVFPDACGLFLCTYPKHHDYDVQRDRGLVSKCRGCPHQGSVGPVGERQPGGLSRWLWLPRHECVGTNRLKC